MRRIQLLNPQLANQIAAGEVVERPAAVLKELLENSLDADARHIDIDIEKGGIQRIRIRDNGIGIHPDDLVLALNRHATSKIYDLHDLEAISSLGFRGEALASISSVSQLTLTSCLRGQSDAWQIKSMDTPSMVIPAAHPEGTTVEMYDLFFNTPARRRFLRAEQTEFAHLEDVFKRITLSHFNVGFTLKHNQKIIRQLRPAFTEKERTQRAADIFGNPFMANAIAIDNTTIDGMRLWGWIALPAFSRNHTDLQYCYVNNRVVRDKLINHAIRLAYQNTLLPGRFPAFILYLEMDPSIVDVNVHPTKHEVRFHESRQIHDFLFSSIRDALAQETSVAMNMLPEDTSTNAPPRLFVQESPPSYALSKTHNKTESSFNAPTFHQSETNNTLKPLGHALAQLHQKYVLAENAQGLVIVDLYAAQKHVAINRLKQTVLSQPLLIPQAIILNETLVHVAEKHQTLLQTLGFDIAQTGSCNVIVRKIPALLKNTALPELLQTLLKTLQLSSENESNRSVDQVNQNCEPNGNTAQNSSTKSRLKRLDFGQGAASVSNRSVCAIHEDCEPSGNAAQNSSAKSLAIDCIAHHIAENTSSQLPLDEMNHLLREIENLPNAKVWRQLHLSEL